MSFVARAYLAPFLRLLGRNWLTLLGASLTTVSALFIVGFLLLGLVTEVDSPYIALMALLVLPGVFIFGLLLIPLGAWLDRKSGRQPGERPLPNIDLNHPRTLRLAITISVFTVLNILIFGVVSYHGVHYTETTEFCGTVCHTVMEPEFVAHQDSPHSRVACVSCHIGSGAPWFVRSKISGLGQVAAVTLNTYQKPIPSPVENLRPSQDTCEQCHWPEKFTGDRIKVIDRFAEDEQNTNLKTILVLHIGGGAYREGGIHSWHIDPARRTRYVSSDPERQEIIWVEVTEPDGSVTEYLAQDSDWTPEQIAAAPSRQMDCIDCHNRPAHTFLPPGEAMDRALAADRIDDGIPFVKQAGTRVLTEVGERMGAAEEVGEGLRDYFQSQHPDVLNSHPESLEVAIGEIEKLYRRNVFPAMNVTWGTYANHVGHEQSPGCFRCHNGMLTSADGRSISMDCSACHNILALDEEDPPILNELGL